jgi:hypothetical protein
MLRLLLAKKRQRLLFYKVEQELQRCGRIYQGAVKRKGNITYTFDKDTKELVVNLGPETTRSIVKKLTSTELEAEESVTDLRVRGFLFTGTVYVTMQKL